MVPAISPLKYYLQKSDTVEKNWIGIYDSFASVVPIFGGSSSLILLIIYFCWRFILAINRKHGPDDALDTVHLAIKYKEKANGIVVGIDLSGDPAVSELQGTSHC